MTNRPPRFLFVLSVLSVLFVLSVSRHALRTIRPRVVREKPYGRSRVVIEAASPEVDGGAFPAKRVLGDVVTAEADIFTDGHDVISAIVLHRPDDQTDWSEVRMRPLVNDRWQAEFPVEALGFHRFT